jgi:hypothetical protein
VRQGWGVGPGVPRGGGRRRGGRRGVGSSVHPWRRRASEQGKAAGRGRRGPSVIDKRDHVATGPGGQRWGARGREKSEAAWWRGTDMWSRPAQCRATQFEMYATILTDSNRFKSIQTLTDSKNTFLCSKNVK